MISKQQLDEKANDIDIVIKQMDKFWKDNIFIEQLAYYISLDKSDIEEAIKHRLSEKFSTKFNQWQRKASATLLCHLDEFPAHTQVFLLKSILKFKDDNNTVDVVADGKKEFSYQDLIKIAKK